MKWLILSILLLALPCAAQDVNVQWDRVPDVTGYKLYYGRTSPPNSFRASVGRQYNRYTFSNLSSGNYYLGVTALSDTNESGLSNIVASEFTTKINAVAGSATTQVVSLSNPAATTIYYCQTTSAACTPMTIYTVPLRMPVNIAAQTICVSGVNGTYTEAVNCLLIKKRVLR